MRIGSVTEKYAITVYHWAKYSSWPTVDRWAAGMEVVYPVRIIKAVSNWLNKYRILRTRTAIYSVSQFSVDPGCLAQRSGLLIIGISTTKYI